jgi:phage shock protein PspC (stress-responsive transcriptional regulator)
LPTKQSYFQANRLLAQLVPQDVLDEVRKLAKRVEQEEKFKAFLLSNFWLVIPAAFLFIAISTGSVSGVYVLLAQYLNFSPEWIRIGLFLSLPVFGIGSFLLQLYFLFSWLERRATAQGIFTGNCDDDAIRKPPKFPWTLFTLLVLAPFAVLFSSSSQFTLIVIAFLLLVPIIYTMLDH